MKAVTENFRDFMISAETHQSNHNPYVSQFLEIGANPKEPFHLEERPEIGKTNMDNMELKHSPADMVLQNLEKIKRCIECMIDTVNMFNSNNNVLEIDKQELNEFYINVFSDDDHGLTKNSQDIKLFMNIIIEEHYD